MGDTVNRQVGGLVIYPVIVINLLIDFKFVESVTHFRSGCLACYTILSVVKSGRNLHVEVVCSRCEEYDHVIFS